MNPPMTAPAGSLFALENRKQLEQSFKDFAARPENKPLLEQHQKEEVIAALQLQEHEQQLQLQQQVQDLDPRDVKLLTPVLQSQVLRQLLISLASHTPAPPPTITLPAARPKSIVTAAVSAAKGEGSSSSSTSSGGLRAWMENPRVLQLLREAGKALRSGRLTEGQLAAVLRQQVQALHQSPAGGSDPQAAPHQAMLPSHLLVEALNEHLTERQAGNTAYKQQRYETAMQHYRRALAVVEFVVGSNADDQAEVQDNKAIVLLNIAAVHMAAQEWGAAVACCDDVLSIQQQGELALKAWLRRSKANLGRHEYEAALCDLSKAHELDPWNEELPVLRATVMHAQKDAAHHTDKVLAAKMFRTAA